MASPVDKIIGLLNFLISFNKWKLSKSPDDILKIFTSIEFKNFALSMSKGVDKNLIKSVEFFDLYESKDLGDNSKSVTFRVTIQSKDKTLEDKDLDQLHKNILEKVSNKFKAKIRS